MPDVSSNASAGDNPHLARARRAQELDHRWGVLPAEGSQLELVQVEHSEKAVRRPVGRLGRNGLAVCYAAAPAATTCIGC